MCLPRFVLDGNLANTLIKEFPCRPHWTKNNRDVLKEAVNNDPATEVAIRWGNFVQLVIVFVIVALVVFLIARTLIREEEAAPAEPSDEVKLLTEIRDALRRTPA